MFVITAPGKQFSMEKAPWKLNAEFVEVMGGYDSSLFKDYRQRCIQAFNVARRHAKSVLTLMSIMQAHSNYPAFRYNANAIRDFRARLFLDRPDSDLPAIIDQLISRYVSYMDILFELSGYDIVFIFIFKSM